MTSDPTVHARHAPASIDLEHVLKVLRRRWWAVVLCTILTAGLALGLSLAQTKQYTAKASLLFTNASVAQQASGVPAAGQTDPQGQRNTNLALVQLGAAVAQQTARQLDAGITAQQVQDAVTASLVGQSNVVSVAATWPDASLAARIANTYAQTFIQLQRRNDQATVQQGINLVNQQLAALSQSQLRDTQGQSLQDHLESLRILKSMQNNTQLAQAAKVPTSPSSPKAVRNAILGGILGFLVGIMLAFLLERFDRGLREPRDVEQAFHLPTLGLIPRGATGRGRGDATKRELEPFRMLRAHLRYFNVDRELRILLVTSAKPSEGKTTISTNLATAAAALGTRTLLVEADLRQPVLAQDLGLHRTVGLAGALVGAGSLQDPIEHLTVEDRTNGQLGGRTLDVLQAGGVPPNPTELLESRAMERLLAWAREHYELVVIDTPPLLVVSDTISLLKHVDGVVIVSRLGLSTRDSAEHLREQLHNLGAPVLGVVVNDVRAKGDFYYGYGYGYRDSSPTLDDDTPAGGERKRRVPDERGGLDGMEDPRSLDAPASTAAATGSEQGSE
jgi:receptor protein-tyrosine kinase